MTQGFESFLSTTQYIYTIFLAKNQVFLEKFTKNNTKSIYYIYFNIKAINFQVVLKNIYFSNLQFYVKYCININLYYIGGNKNGRTE